MPNQQRFEGPDLEKLLEEVRTSVGEDAAIVEANRLRKGGVAGFFAKERYEVLVDVDEDSPLRPVPPPVTAPQRRGGATASSVSARAQRSTDAAGAPTAAVPFESLLELADSVSADERAESFGTADRAGRPAVTPFASVLDDAVVERAAQPQRAYEPTTSTSTDPEEELVAPSVDDSAFVAELDATPLVIDGWQDPTAGGDRAPIGDDGAATRRASRVYRAASDPQPAPSSDPPTAAPQARVVNGTPTSNRAPSAPATNHTTNAKATNGVATAPAVHPAQPPASPQAPPDPAPANPPRGVRRPEEAFTPRAAAAPAPGPAPRAIAAPVPAPAPAPVRTYEADRTSGPARALSRVGIPDELLEGRRLNGTAVDLAAVLAGLPVAPPLPTVKGAVVAIAGERSGAIDLAMDLAAELGLDGDQVYLASSTYKGRAIGRDNRLTSPETAREHRLSWRRRAALTIVVVDAPDDGAGVQAASEMLDAIEPTVTWAVVDATAKPDDLRAWVELIGVVDALVVTRTTATVSPGAVLQVGIPVARLDGEPASPERWAALLGQRLGW